MDLHSYSSIYQTNNLYITNLEKRRRGIRALKNGMADQSVPRNGYRRRRFQGAPRGPN